MFFSFSAARQIPILAVLAILPLLVARSLPAQIKPGHDDTEHGVPRPTALPRAALVVAARPLPGRPDRALILWMLKPESHPNETAPEDPYTCPEQTRGSYYRGPTRVSLVDVKTDAIINTIEIKDGEGEDTFDVPYAIRPDYYYKVASKPKKGFEGEADVLSFDDRNGDGKKHEFALFDAPACMGLATALIGYSERQDTVIQYPIELKMKGDGQEKIDTSLWALELFAKKPDAAGKWKFEVDFRGRGGPLQKYEIAYNPKREVFEGTLQSEDGDGPE